MLSSHAAGNEDGSRDVAATRLAAEPPAVVGGDRAEIDDGQAGIGQAVA